MDEWVIVRKNIALRMAIEHGSGKKKSACKEVNTYKVDGAVFLASVGEQKVRYQT